MSKISIRKLYRNFQIENLELSLASVKTSCGISGLPKYFQIYRLHKLGLWTHPNTYPQYPVLALQAKTRNSYLKKIPDLSAGVDPLISKDIEWCSNSDEASNFRLKYNCLFSEIKSSDGVGRYPQFIDSYHDPKIFENKSIAAYIIYRSNTVSKFEVQILRSMKLEHLMISLREKLQKTKVELHVDMWVLKFAESSEYI